MYLVFAHVTTSKLFDESWVFVPDQDIVFHRVSEQASFDPNMKPSGSIVCCEITNSDGRGLEKLSNTEIVDRTISDLTQIATQPFDVIQTKVVKLPDTYPVYLSGYERGLAKILTELDEFENFKSIGRQGAFNYIGTIDCMDIGYGYVNWWNNRSEINFKSERKRTEAYRYWTDLFQSIFNPILR